MLNFERPRRYNEPRVMFKLFAQLLKELKGLEESPVYMTHSYRFRYVLIATMGTVMVPSGPNAAFIVRACNAHEALVEAVEQFIRHLNDPDGPSFPFTIIEEARAALATARGAGSEDD